MPRNVPKIIENDILGGGGGCSAVALISYFSIDKTLGTGYDIHFLMCHDS